MSGMTKAQQLDILKSFSDMITRCEVDRHGSNKHIEECLKDIETNFQPGPTMTQLPVEIDEILTKCPTDEHPVKYKLQKIRAQAVKGYYDDFAPDNAVAPQSELILDMMNLCDIVRPGGTEWESDVRAWAKRVAGGIIADRQSILRVLMESDPALFYQEIMGIQNNVKEGKYDS